MKPPVLAFLLAFASFSAAPATDDAGSVRLREASLHAEFTAASGEVTLVASAEGETGLDRVEIRNPLGVTLVGLATADRGRSLGLFGFRLEVGETDRASFFATYPAGDYLIRAHARDGRTAIGTARLSHEVPLPPVSIYPQEDDVGVPASGLRVSWLPDPQVARYDVNLEQGETDLLAVRLAAGTSSFVVPDGVLEPGRRYKLEIGAVGAEGNCTIKEVSFRTR